MKFAIPLCVLLTVPATYGDPYLYLEDLGSTPFVPLDARTYDLTVDTQGLDWSIATMSIDIVAGDVWQHSTQGDFPPSIAAYFEDLTVLWDTFVTFPEAVPNTDFGDYFGGIMGGSLYRATTGGAPIVWFDHTLNRDGPYVLARLTVTDDFVGEIHGTSWFSETGAEQYPFSLWIPEPGTLVGLVLLGTFAARRR